MTCGKIGFTNPVPEKKIADFVGMKLTGATGPVLTPDMAASWGCFDLKNRAFQVDALEALGLRPELLPRVDTAYGILGETPAGVPVACALGDNQASVLGSVSSPEDTVLINVGTGSQITVSIREWVACGDGLCGVVSPGCRSSGSLRSTIRTTPGATQMPPFRW